MNLSLLLRSISYNHLTSSYQHVGAARCVVNSAKTNSAKPTRPGRFFVFFWPSWQLSLAESSENLKVNSAKLSVILQ